MASTIYNIEIEKVDLKNKKVVALVQVIYPEAEITPTYGFALEIIQNLTEEDSLLSRIVSFDNILDDSWVKKHAKGIIKQVTLLKLENEIPQEAYLDGTNWKADKLPSGKLEIEVTHADWIRHIEKGMETDSVGNAFDLSEYQESSPILPEKEGKAELTIDYENSEGWMPFPGMFYFFRSKMININLPKIIFIPKYDSRCYKAISKTALKKDQITYDNLNQFYGKAVIVKIPDFYGGKDEKIVGMYFNDADKIFIILDSKRYTLHIENIKEIALAGFNINSKILGTPRKYQSLLWSISPVVKSVKVNGTTIEFDIAGLNPRRTPLTEGGKANMLLLLAYCLKLEDDDVFNNDYPLGEVLNYAIQNKLVNDKNKIYNELADAMIKSFTIGAMKEITYMFEKSNNKKVIEYCENDKWPVTQIAIEVYDPEYLKHYQKVSSFCLNKDGFDDISEKSRDWENPVMFHEYKKYIKR